MSKIAFYNFAALALSPLLLAQKSARFLRRREDYEWALDRAFAPKIAPKSKRRRVVFVALSWGETAMLERLSREIEARRDDVEIVWAIREKAARKLAKTHFPTRVLAPMPFDFAPFARLWAARTAPDVLVVLEKFWWPNLLFAAKARGAKIVLANGRARGRKTLRYKLLAPYQRWILGAFDAILLGDQSQIENLREVLPRPSRAVATGNIKFAFTQIEPPKNADSLRIWATQNGEKPLFVAGSTHESDENWLLETFPFDDANLLLAPRDLRRADAVFARFSEKFRVARRSENPDSEGAPVLLLDSMGELPFVYQWARAAYVGGAISGRGHNILEPLAWNVPVSYGPNRGDFEGAQRAAEEFEVGFRCEKPQQLREFWHRFLERQADFSTRCTALFAANASAFEFTVTQILAQIG